MQIKVIISSLAAGALAHVEMKWPAPRQSQFRPNPTFPVDYAQNSPLGIYPCKGHFEPGPAVASYRAGQHIDVELLGSANHNGGHCEFSLSYDNGRTFTTITTILDSCLKGDARNYRVLLPPGAPPRDNVLFAWTWINTTGDREFYMNCADIRITNPNPGRIEGHRPVLANLPDCAERAKGLPIQYDARGCPFKDIDCPYIAEWTDFPNCSGHELFTSRPKVFFP
ncbi:hypothetical protein DSO57_1033873 [Entomophthora muscae]|uniref:Uncharacterized protein n=1 Tax=Entomophthora muscae TaxID=34485 RepID=A0ACC2UAE3_9FUNG|nr:hypothetical protein DSO57_1033873 [Entomophthora muscae]